MNERTIDLPPEVGARVVVRGLASKASAAAERLAAGADDETLHDFRIALRRLRSTLRALRPWLEDRLAPRHERKLREIARSTNAARDAEVQLAWLRDQGAAHTSARRRAALALLVDRFEARTRAGADPARAAVRYGRVAAKLRRRLRTHGRKVGAGAIATPSFGGVLAVLVGEQLGAMGDRMAAIGGPADEDAVHRARIEGKRLRYLLEPLRGHRDADATAAVEHLKRVQNVLGDLHDTHVLAGELREVLVEAAGQRARQLHAAVFSGAAREPAHERPPIAGLVWLARVARERRDTLYALLERERRAGGMDTLAAEVRAIAASLEARAGGRQGRERNLALAAVPASTEIGRRRSSAVPSGVGSGSERSPRPAPRRSAGRSRRRSDS